MSTGLNVQWLNEMNESAIELICYQQDDDVTSNARMQHGKLARTSLSSQRCEVPIVQDLLHLAQVARILLLSSAYQMQGYNISTFGDNVFWNQIAKYENMLASKLLARFKVTRPCRG